MKVDIEALKKAIKVSKVPKKEIAAEIGIHPSTLYRKMEAGGKSFTVGQAGRLVEVIRLPGKEAASIFFGEELAEMQERQGDPGDGQENIS